MSVLRASSGRTSPTTRAKLLKTRNASASGALRDQRSTHLNEPCTHRQPLLRQHLQLRGCCAPCRARHGHSVRRTMGRAAPALPGPFALCIMSNILKTPTDESIKHQPHAPGQATPRASLRHQGPTPTGQRRPNTCARDASRMVLPRAYSRTCAHGALPPTHTRRRAHSRAHARTQTHAPMCGNNDTATAPRCMVAPEMQTRQ